VIAQELAYLYRDGNLVWCECLSSKASVFNPNQCDVATNVSGRVSVTG
jgi:hypothetical protein